MRIIVFVVAILASTCIAKRVTHPGNKHLKRVTRQPCDPKWQKLYANHTMCLNDVGTEVVLDSATKAQIVERHNEIRSEAKPRIFDRVKMIWDDELALVASKWARQCSKWHDKMEMRVLPSLPDYKIGQNLAVGQKDFMGAINAWNDEKKDYKPLSSILKRLHYIEMIRYHTLRIGCGQAKCPGTFSDVYVCNYARSNTMYNFEKSSGYKIGRCSSCPDTCDTKSKMCVCEPTVCLNSGYEFCGCKCRKKYTGKHCETVRDECLRPDPDYCKKGGVDCKTTTSCWHQCNFCQDILEIEGNWYDHEHVFI